MTDIVPYEMKDGKVTAALVDGKRIDLIPVPYEQLENVYQLATRIAGARERAPARTQRDEEEEEDTSTMTFDRAPGLPKKVRKSDEFIAWPQVIFDSQPSLKESVRGPGYMPWEIERVRNSITRYRATIGRVIERSRIGKHNARALIELLIQNGEVETEEDGHRIYLRRKNNN